MQKLMISTGIRISLAFDSSLLRSLGERLPFSVTGPCTRSTLGLRDRLEMVLYSILDQTWGSKFKWVWLTLQELRCSLDEYENLGNQVLIGTSRKLAAYNYTSSLSL